MYPLYLWGNSSPRGEGLLGPGNGGAGLLRSHVREGCQEFTTGWVFHVKGLALGAAAQPLPGN